MKYLFISSIYLSITILFFANEVSAQPVNPCKNITLQFEQKLKNVPLTVYYKDNVVGIASALPTSANKPQVVTVCIDEKSAMTIEKNALCYIQNDQIVIFNIWSAGVLLKDNIPMKGFADWTSALFYFVKELPRLIYGTAMDFGMKFIGTFIDKNIDPKTKLQTIQQTTHNPEGVSNVLKTPNYSCDIGICYFNTQRVCICKT